MNVLAIILILINNNYVDLDIPVHCLELTQFLSNSCLKSDVTVHLEVSVFRKLTAPNHIMIV